MLVEWIISLQAAADRVREKEKNARVSEFSAARESRLFPVTEDERLQYLSTTTAEIEKRKAERQSVFGTSGTGNYNPRVREIDVEIGMLETQRQRLIRMKEAELAYNATQKEAIALEAERTAQLKALGAAYEDWLTKNGSDIDTNYAKTRTAAMSDGARMTEIRRRMAAGAAAVSTEDVVGVDVNGINARALVEQVIPGLEARFAKTERGTPDHARLELAVKKVREWATELQGLESEFDKIYYRAGSMALAGQDLQLELQIGKARLAGNDALVEDLEYKRELLRAEEQINSIVRSGVMDRARASELIKGQLEDTRALAAQEKARKQAELRRDDAGDLAVLELRAKGRDKEAEALQRELGILKEIDSYAKDRGISAEQAEARLRRLSALEQQADQRRKDASGKTDSKSKPNPRSAEERGWRTNKSGHKEYRTADGDWLRPEDMTHQQRLASGTANYVTDGAVAVGMKGGMMDHLTDRYLGRNAYATPELPSASRLALATVRQTLPQAAPAQPATAAPAAAPAPVATQGGAQAAGAISSAADGVASEVNALVGATTAGMERIAAAAQGGISTISQRCDRLEAQIKAQRN